MSETIVVAAGAVYKFAADVVGIVGCVRGCCYCDCRCFCGDLVLAAVPLSGRRPTVYLREIISERSVHRSENLHPPGIFLLW
jgi:DNA repair photolyase